MRTTRSPSRPITICDLLTHTAGFEALSGTTPVAELYRRAGIAGIPATGTLVERAADLARIPLAFDPGTRFTYHYASDLVGHLCELISGQPLDRFFAERILEPLGMTDTAFRVPASKRDRLTANYEQVHDATPRFRRRAVETDAPTPRMPRTSRAAAVSPRRLWTTCGSAECWRAAESSMASAPGPRTLQPHDREPPPWRWGAEGLIPPHLADVIARGTG
jgi:CubicO group peptidase (beta-lactamase class C family)